MLACMETTFFFAFIFPPPSSGTEILAFFDGSRTRRTTDAHKTFIVQGIVWNVVLLNISLYLIKFPMQ